MDDLSKYSKGNSINQQNDEGPQRKKQHIERVVRVSPTLRKPGAWARVKSVFIAQDSRSIKDAVIFGVVIPKLKDMLFDAATEGAHAALYSDAPRSNRSRYSSRDDRRPTQYNRPYSRQGEPDRGRERERDRDDREQLDHRARAMHDFSGLTFRNAGDAEGVVDRLFQHIDEFGVVSVNDFYDAAGMTGDFTDDNHGWTNLGQMKVRKVRDGYIIDLPRTHEID